MAQNNPFPHKRLSAAQLPMNDVGLKDTPPLCETHCKL